MPAVPGSLLEPIWEPFSALLPDRPAVAPTHPLRCHRPRIPDRIVFAQVVAALVHGSGDERIATAGCSDRTIRRSRCATPRRRGWCQPPRCPAARSHPRRGGGARAPKSTVHLDRGSAGKPTRALLDVRGREGVIARKGVPAPIQAGQRWVVERTQGWMNGYGTLRRCTEKTAAVVDVSLFLAAAFVVTRCLIRTARTRYRWATRPTTRRLR